MILPTAVPAQHCPLVKKVVRDLPLDGLTFANHPFPNTNDRAEVDTRLVSCFTYRRGNPKVEEEGIGSDRKTETPLCCVPVFAEEGGWRTETRPTGTRTPARRVRTSSPFS